MTQNQEVEAARQIVAWADDGKLADDEWLVERNETAIIAICRAYLSAVSPPTEGEVREVVERLETLAREALSWDMTADSPIIRKLKAMKEARAAVYTKAAALLTRLSQPSAEEARRAAIEECARVAESLVPNYEPDGWGHAALDQAAHHIRALSPPIRETHEAADDGEGRE